jgi:glycosyltransferase involved in cell wall biosynthesis
MYPTPDRPQTGPFVARRVASLRARGVDVVVAGPTSYQGSSAIRHLRIAWRAVTARGPFDGVEAHPVYFAGVIGLLAARLRRRPLLAYAHGGDVAEYAVRSRFARALAGWVVRGAGAVVANSLDTAGYVERLGARAMVISPGVDMTLFRQRAGSAGDRRALRERLGLPDGLLALYVGTLSERKGADVFAEAIGLAGEPDGVRAPWTGVMLGDGPLASSLAASSSAVQQHRPVPADQVPDWLCAADVVVVPSRREPLGLAAVEALACGAAVVASSVGGLKEVVHDEQSGLLVPPGDPKAIAAALARLADAGLRSRLGAAGPAAVSGHDASAVAAEMAEVWSELGVRA